MSEICAKDVKMITMLKTANYFLFSMTFEEYRLQRAKIELENKWLLSQECLRFEAQIFSIYHLKFDNNNVFSFHACIVKHIL